MMNSGDQTQMHIFRIKYVKIVIGLTVLGLLCHLFSGCGIQERIPASADAVLKAMLSAAGEYPHGRLRNTSSASDTPEYLTTELLSSLYGEATRQWCHETSDGGKDIVDDAAIYLSEAPHPFEMAVFRCTDEGDLSGGMGSVLGICSSRLDLIRNAWKGTDYATLTEGAVVAFYGQFVLLIVAEETEDILQAAENAIRAGDG